ncbi:unnamed protein product [Owenia fusiformis]|uniref:Uncharacterized protein n=1 Tax=Owenia fusiformis TaxID=6347 RepID=A0A8S4NCQ5_OWEFU|nr:unnamed protein product [Owenia fusiformis]
MNQTSITKDVFLFRAHSNHLKTNKIAQKGYIPDIWNVLEKHNLEDYLLNYLDNGYFPPNKLWNKICRYQVKQTQICSENRANRADARIPTNRLREHQLWKTAQKDHTILRESLTMAKVISMPLENRESLCEKCGMLYNDTISHILQECANHNSQREQVIRALNLNQDEEFSRLPNVSAMSCRPPDSNTEISITVVTEYLHYVDRLIRENNVSLIPPFPNTAQN